MVLSRLACILIRMYASQVAEARIETVRGVGYRIVAP
jgi:DNA-binding response OmpR family regulator